MHGVAQKQALFYTGFFQGFPDISCDVGKGTFALDVESKFFSVTFHFSPLKNTSYLHCMM
jgi:hypothetical protein